MLKGEKMADESVEALRTNLLENLFRRVGQKEAQILVQTFLQNRHPFH